MRPAQISIRSKFNIQYFIVIPCAQTMLEAIIQRDLHMTIVTQAYINEIKYTVFFMSGNRYSCDYLRSSYLVYSDLSVITEFHIKCVETRVLFIHHFT